MFVQVFLIGLLSGISPGPDFAVVMRNSLSFGRRTGVASALGIGTALGIHVTYTVLGFAVILQHSPSLFGFIQLLGAAYLLWLAQGAIRAKKPKQGMEDSGIKEYEEKPFWTGFREGFLCNMLNPKAALFFLSIFSQFLTPETPGWVRWVYGGEIMFAVGAWFVFLATVISSATFRRYYGAYRHWFNRVLGGVLLFFAIKIIVGLVVL